MKQYTDEEVILRQLTKGSNPFHTPQGYFDKLPGQVMKKIKARQKRRFAIRWAVAAVMTGCIATAGLLMLDRDIQETAYPELAHAQYIEDALDYSMIDNAEIAYYLTEAE
ncbi:MAG: hypothetical protein ACI4B5_02930 [Bacteroidaceae bacterium]